MKTSTLLAIGRYLLTALAATPVGASHPASSAAAPQAPPAATKVQFVEVAATVNTLRQLRAGGYTLYLRHGPTNNAIADRVPVDLNDCSTQRPLSEAGRQLMAKVGESMRRARIPIGDFKVSPMCRARQSATAAFPLLTPVVDPQLMYVANFTDAEKAPIIANTRKLLSSPVTGTTNRLVLAHAPNLMDLMGYFPQEGTLVIFRPKGVAQEFDYIASVPPALWTSLLQQDHP